MGRNCPRNRPHEPTLFQVIEVGARFALSICTTYRQLVLAYTFSEFRVSFLYFNCEYTPCCEMIIMLGEYGKHGVRIESAIALAPLGG